MTDKTEQHAEISDLLRPDDVQTRAEKPDDQVGKGSEAQEKGEGLEPGQEREGVGFPKKDGPGHGKNPESNNRWIKEDETDAHRGIIYQEFGLREIPYSPNSGFYCRKSASLSRILKSKRLGLFKISVERKLQ